MCPAARDPSRLAFAKSSSAGRESSTGGRETSTDSSTGEASRGSVNPSWSCRPATQKNSRPGCGPWASAWPWPRSRSPVRVWRRSGGRVPSMLDDAEWERLSTLYNGWIDDVADVPAGVEAPRDEGEGLLRDRLRLFQVRRDPDDREGPGGRRVQVASRLVDARVVQPRTGLPDAVLVDLQLLSGPRMGTVSHGNDVLADRRLMREPEGRREVSFREGLTRLEEVILQDRQDVHRFRVREPDVELEELGSVFRRHEAAVQDAFERRSAGGHRGDRLAHRFECALEILPRDERQAMIGVAIGTHPARVRSLVPFIRTLVILRERRGHESMPVAKGLERKLLADQLLLHEEPGDAADLFRQDLLPVGERVRLRREVIAPHADALPSREAQRLDHELEIGPFHEFLEARGIVEGPERRATGDPVIPHEGARELLVRLQLGRLPSRADGRDPRLLERVRDPLLQGGLGPDDRQLGPTLRRPFDDVVDRGHVDEENVLRTTAAPWILVGHRAVGFRAASMEGL